MDLSWLKYIVVIVISQSPLGVVYCLYIDEIAKQEYVKSERPLKDGPPVNVTIQLKLWTMSDIKEADFSYEMSYILNTWWNDPRLKHTSGLLKISEPPDKHIWYPALMVLNSDNNARVGADVITRIYENGDVHVNQRMKAKCVCTMDLSSYPMDLQKCPFGLTSYAYSSAHLNIFWHKGGVIEVDGFAVPGYSYEGSNSKKFVQNYTIGSERIFWDVLEVKFHLRRRMKYHIFSIYIPCALLMVFNLGSYWIPHRALPGRITLLVTTFLTTTYILKSVSERTSKGTAVTSLHIFTVVNLTFIVMAMVEYLCVLNIKHQQINKIMRISMRLKGKNPKEENNKTSSKDNDVINGQFTADYQKVYSKSQEEGNNPDVNGDELTYDRMDEVHILDEICRSVMPILYVCFCLTYFVYFLNIK